MNRLNFYFFASNEGNLIILAGINQIIKHSFSQATTTIFISDISRLQKTDKYSSLFDQKIVLPNCNFSKNIFKGFKNIRKYINELRKIDIESGSVIFIFEIYELIELLFYSHIKRNSVKKKLKLIIISAFEGSEIEEKNKQLLVFGSIYLSIYSIPYTNKILKEYNEKGFNIRLRNFSSTGDFQFCINNSRSRSKATSTINNLPYPAIILSHYVSYENIKLLNNSILILLDSSSFELSIGYWDKVNDLIEYLVNNLAVNVYIKDHPTWQSQNKNLNITEHKNSSIIYEKLAAEEIYISNIDKILCVLGYGSTGLITASWFGIPALNISSYLGYSNILLKRFRNILTLGRNIKEIEDLTEISNVRIHSLKSENNCNELETIKSWDEAIQAII